MPCFSKITKTAIKDRERLIETLKELGYNLYTLKADYVEGKSEKYGYAGYYLQKDGTWSVGTFESERAKTGAAETGKLYARKTVMDWSKRRMFNVMKSTADSVTLVRR